MNIHLQPKRLAKEPKLAIAILKKKYQVRNCELLPQRQRNAITLSPLKRTQTSCIKDRSISQFHVYTLQVDEIVQPKINSKLLFPHPKSPNMPFNLHHMLKEMKKYNKYQ